MENKKYIAFLRGINVGGHKKVPMADLKKMMTSFGLENVKTLLNSGNVVFSAPATTEKKLEEKMSVALEKTFGFPVPVLIRTSTDFQELLKSNPFKKIEVHKDLRLYITFLKNRIENSPIKTPWSSEDKSFQILNFTGVEIISVLNVSEKRTIEAMKLLENTFGKDLTTRNWNTVLKIGKLL
ncbi:hypothetical protein APR41_07175 [Salegentibacter salinarum]|uniref:DUF1697 domain-containing protein n=1 Tax=Salegentibacter salinarum TaxID=447422 RepID=A0A2N0TR47_9FLAO|nr:DUF1697 domain-containing protein [Salegentibacter salinarum]PKD17205.1 hypothetical protein APR41_07175 [Salegentibacter salinarum]SKB56391.1 Uncharacterized conserved protein, DUF1697 family [Salegentibacter salinarum]